MQTRQDLRNRNPVYICSQPSLAKPRGMFADLKDRGYFLPELTIAVLLGALIHSFM